MEDTLVSFETAKLAKEKGFIEICDRVSLNESIRVQHGFRNYPEQVFPTVLQMPTQSLLQAWLRRIHRWHIEVIPDDAAEDIRWVAVVYHLDNMKEHLSLEYCDGFEEALELGLAYTLSQL